MKPVVFSIRAERDLEDIGDYIARDNPRRALSFVREMRKRCRDMSDFPENNPPFPQLGPNACFCPHGNYLDPLSGLGGVGFRRTYPARRAGYSSDYREGTRSTGRLIAGFPSFPASK
uniref:Plasmid stabilization system protein ParE n=1 Tax=Candidatus Kentrum sp. TUN TaxID=2126343 RepID=A0A451A8F3_9GAMM|nr:MAG: Plasmid stabilization system protein ParE [Candidatus Kentron sp. TUN]VFK57799.1 MAG: Plasmid stabilization system protein ParE [Candidatus Kentron sp. TUN]VFK62313.1 MAG: Plasmid stabilization system protein ParE [Candidatus Kentron sp. TUN]